MGFSLYIAGGIIIAVVGGLLLNLISPPFSLLTKKVWAKVTRRRIVSAKKMDEIKIMESIINPLLRINQIPSFSDTHVNAPKWLLEIDEKANQIHSKDLIDIKTKLISFADKTKEFSATTRLDQTLNILGRDNAIKLVTEIRAIVSDKMSKNIKMNKTSRFFEKCKNHKILSILVIAFIIVIFLGTFTLINKLTNISSRNTIEDVSSRGKEMNELPNNEKNKIKEVNTEHVTFEQFAKKYYESLQVIITALPAKITVPECLHDTSFVIFCSDETGKSYVDIISRKNLGSLIIDNKEISPVSRDLPYFLEKHNLSAIEKFMFQQDDRGNTVSINVNEKNFILDGLSFSNKEYNEKYWKNATFYRNCAGTIPFAVGPQGGILGLDLLWGSELNGKRQERLFEFVRIFGNKKMIPLSIKEIRDMAFRDFRHCVPKIGKESVPKIGKEQDEFSFTNFIQNLSTPVDQNVLILGSYKNSKSKFEKLKIVLKELGYNGFLLSDSPDLPIQTNQEKLFAGIIYSSFVIVVEDEASGHIAELTTMLQFNFRPVIIIRSEDVPATHFLEDKILTNDFFKVASFKEITAVEILPFISWARKIITEQIKNLNSINKWR